MLKLVLASASPRRIELLTQVGIEFSVMPANINEDVQGFSDPGKYAQEMSRLKALSVAQRLQSEASESVLVLGADTVVSIEGKIFGKPQNKDHARQMLKELESRWHQVITGITLVRPTTMQANTQAEISSVRMTSYPAGFLERYISTEEPYDKAGGYAIQGYGSLMVECIGGCYFNIMGLPLYRLSSMLMTEGYEPLSWLE